MDQYILCGFQYIQLLLVYVCPCPMKKKMYIQYHFYNLIVTIWSVNIEMNICHVIYTSEKLDYGKSH